MNSLISLNVANIYFLEEKCNFFNVILGYLFSI